MINLQIYLPLRSAAAFVSFLQPCSSPSLSLNKPLSSCKPQINGGMPDASLEKRQTTALCDKPLPLRHYLICFGRVWR